MVFEGGKGQHGGGLGQAVASDVGAAQFLLHGPHKSWRAGRPAHHQPVEAAQVVAAQVRGVEEHVDHSGHHSGQGDTLIGNKLKDLFRLEFLDHDVSAAHAGEGLGRPPAVGVKERDGMQLYVAVGES